MERIIMARGHGAVVQICLTPLQRGMLKFGDNVETASVFRNRLQHSYSEVPLDRGLCWGDGNLAPWFLRLLWVTSPEWSRFFTENGIQQLGKISWFSFHAKIHKILDKKVHFFMMKVGIYWIINDLLNFNDVLEPDKDYSFCCQFNYPTLVDAGLIICCWFN